MRFFETDEQRRIRIRSLFQVFLEVYLGASVEIDLTLFISFTEHHTLAFLEIDVLTIDFYQLSNAYQC